LCANGDDYTGNVGPQRPSRRLRAKHFEDELRVRSIAQRTASHSIFRARFNEFVVQVMVRVPSVSSVALLSRTPQRDVALCHGS
jgi:hypothetical protein